MERFAHRRWLKFLAAASAVLLTVAMLSFHPNDPTLTNLRQPSGGSANLVSLLGALLGGSLVEFLGASALWLPLLIANRLLANGGKGGWARSVGYGSALMLFSASAHGVASPAPGLGLGSAGLVGLAATRWVDATTGPWVGGGLLAWGIGFCLWRLFSVSLLGGALRDGRMFLAYFIRQTSKRLQVGWGALVGATSALRASPKAKSRGGAGLSFGPAAPSPRRHPGGHASLGIVQGEPRQSGEIKSGPVHPAQVDEFDAWFARLGENATAPKPIEKP